VGFDRIACKTGLGRSQQQRSIESTKLLALSPNTNPTNLLQQNQNPKINNTTNQDQTERECLRAVGCTGSNRKRRKWWSDEGVQLGCLGRLAIDHRGRRLRLLKWLIRDILAANSPPLLRERRDFLGGFFKFLECWLFLNFREQSRWWKRRVLGKRKGKS